MHKSVTIERVMELVELNEQNCENWGICHACGEEQDGCEPDARKYECESCGERQVYGAEETLIMIG